MSRQIFISLFICWALHVSDAFNENCNKEGDLLQRCSLNSTILNFPNISFTLTREELNKSCINLQSSISCIQNYTNVCMARHDRILFRKIYAGTTEVVKELCTPGAYQDEYLKHANCVKNVRAEFETCSKKYKATLTTVSNRQKNEQYNMDQGDVGTSYEDYYRLVCCSFKEYLQCSEQTAQRTCGDDAAIFTSKYLKQMSSNIVKNSCLAYGDQECGLPGKVNP